MKTSSNLNGLTLAACILASATILSITLPQHTNALELGPTDTSRTFFDAALESFFDLPSELQCLITDPEIRALFESLTAEKLDSLIAHCVIPDPVHPLGEYAEDVMEPGEAIESAEGILKTDKLVRGEVVHPSRIWVLQYLEGAEADESDDPPVFEYPRLINQETPHYPELAVDNEESGEVWMSAFIDMEGIVRVAKVIKAVGCDCGFSEAALESAYKKRYAPARANGHPVAVLITYKETFQISTITETSKPSTSQ